MSLLRRLFLSKSVAYRLMLVWVVCLSILYSCLSVLRHTHFQSGAFDLGIFDQSVWQYANVVVPFNTIKERFILGDHLNLTLPLLAPLFWLWDSVLALLIFQAVFIAVSSIAIFTLSLLRGFSPFVSLCVAYIYSIFYGFQFGVYFDFHPVIVGVGLLAWLLYFFEAKKTKLFWITLVLLLLTQENMGIAIACVGMIYIWKKHYRTHGFAFIVGGVLVSFIAVKIVGMLSPVGYQYWPTLGVNPIGLLTKFFDTHEKRLVWAYSFGWFSFLPLFSPGVVLAVFFDLSQYFIPQYEFGHMTTPYLHHRAILAPLLTLGLLDVLALVKRRIPASYVVGVLVVSVLVQQFVFHFPLNKLSKPAYWRQERWMQDTVELFTYLPYGASVAAAQNIVPHLSHRKEIYLVYPRINDAKCTGCWWLEYAGKPQYLVVNSHPFQWTTQLLESPEHFQEAITNMKREGAIEEFKTINTATIYSIIYPIEK